MFVGVKYLSNYLRLVDYKNYQYLEITNLRMPFTKKKNTAILKLQLQTLK